MESLIILALALGLDLVLGEPPVNFHPVVWLGRSISALEKRSPSQGPVKQFVYGLCSLIFITATSVALVVLILAFSLSINTIIYIVVGSFLLKSTFAIKMLFRAVNEVAIPLKRGDLTVARENLKSLVSRDPSQLSEQLIAAAAVESVAENSADSIVAPIFYFALFGVPGAIAYRAINTFDSMWGYHGRYEYLGKAAARLDDVVSFVPARLAAFFLVLIASLTGRGRRAWKTMLKYRRETESPNAGWTMSAAAGALGIQLEKTGHYRLGDASEELSVDKINEATRLVKGEILIAILFSTGLVLLVSNIFPS